MMTNAILKGSQVNYNGRPYPIKARYKEMCLFDLNWMWSLKTFFYCLFQLARCSVQYSHTLLMLEQLETNFLPDFLLKQKFL